MNTKLVLFLSCFAAVALTASAVNADPRGGGHGRHFSSMSRGGQTFTRSAPTYSGRNWSGQNWSGQNWSGQNWSGRNWSGSNWSGDWRRHHHHRFSNDQFIFLGGFGFPFFGYPYYGYYPYDYGYGYGYGYPYGYDYYGGSAYGYGYGDQGYGYTDQGYGYGSRNRGGSSVVQLQRRLARAGYYHGAIDGIMGPETRRAIRAYERSHNEREYGMTDRY
jgi:Putative peptidoglycan binding domain